MATVLEKRVIFDGNASGVDVEKGDASSPDTICWCHQREQGQPAVPHPVWHLWSADYQCLWRLLDLSWQWFGCWHCVFLDQLKCRADKNVVKKNNLRYECFFKGVDPAIIQKWFILDKFGMVSGYHVQKHLYAQHVYIVLHLSGAILNLYNDLVYFIVRLSISFLALMINPHIFYYLGF